MNPNDLTPHRIQLHYAIQFIAAVGSALGEVQSDGSQGALDWDEDLGGFVGKTIPGTQIQVALLPESLTSLILQNHQAIASLSLADHTMADALEWHKSALATFGLPADTITLLEYPPDDFPDHPLAHGAEFEDLDPAGRSAIAAYYAKTRSFLASIVADNPSASPITIWPHHFDMATLMTYPSNSETDTKYIGVGLSPGDTSYSEPYWYITPYPYPALADLPKLPSHGFWHTQHWVGAVLLASQAQSDSAIQAFIKSTVDHSKALLNIS